MRELQNVYINGACNYTVHALNARGKPMDKRHTTLNRTPIVVLSIFALLVLAATASATDYYMTTGGNDSNTGTSLDTAWATMSHAQGQLSAGDTLHIADGTYYNDAFVAQVSGTAADPITIRAYNGVPTFIESGTTRTLDLFNFGDANAAPGAPYPVEHYNIEGFRAENYRQTFTAYYASNHLNLTNIDTKDCRYAVHLHRGCYDIIMKDFTVENAYYAPFHFWYDNHDCTLENVAITGTIHDHGIIDFHTNNDNFTVRNINFHGEMDYGEAIYLHGDHGTNDDNSFYDITINMILSTGSTTKECIDIWHAGYNNYFENLTLQHTGGGSSLINIGETSGLGADNLTFKDVRLIDAGARAVYLEFGNDVGDVLFENLTIINCGAPQDIALSYGNRVGSVIFRDLKGDNNDFSIYCSNGVSNDCSIEFTDRKVFSENYANTDPYYHLDRSTISVVEEGVKTIRYYPLTAVPSSGSAEVIVNKFDTSLSRGETLVDVTANTVSGNEVTFTISDLTSGTNYLVKRDGVDFATKQANSAGHIEFSNSEWSSAHRFTVVESDTLTPLTPLVTSLQSDTPTQNTITLRWDCSTPDVDHYTINKDGAYLDTTENKYCNANNLAPDTTYTFEVSATNKDGITGDGASITVKTAAEASHGHNIIYIANDVIASRGSYVIVPIMIYNATGIACEGVNLTYDSTVVNVIGVKQGDFTTYFGFDDGSAADGWVTVNTYVRETSLTGTVKIADVLLKAVGDAGDTSPLNMEIIAMTGQNGHPVSGTVRNGLFTVVSDTSPPVVTNSSASQLIPDDTDGVPSWGEIATLRVTVTDESDIAGVTIDLSSIGGSPVQPMAYIGNNVWSVTTNAAAGTPPQAYNLAVCATDIHGYTNMQESVELIVMRNGDVTGDNDVTLDDVALLENYVTYPGRYTISSEFVADVSGDGAINIVDAMMLANYLANPDQRPIRCVENTC
ncbi:MAG: dockerin type I domain-containing protein [Methanosarcinaceae archaeon]